MKSNNKNNKTLMFTNLTKDTLKEILLFLDSQSAFYICFALASAEKEKSHLSKMEVARLPFFKGLFKVAATIQRKEDTIKVLKEIDNTIAIAKSNDYKRHLFEHDVNELVILREGIEKIANGVAIDLNAKLDIPAFNQFYRARNTYLKLAAAMCKTEVVEYLLKNGAKPSEDIVFFPIQFQNQNLQAVLKVLQHHGADINPKCILLNANYLLFRLSDHGHRLLFWAKRKECTEYNTSFKDLDRALTNNDVKMGVRDRFSLPGAKIAEKIEGVIHALIPRC